MGVKSKIGFEVYINKSFNKCNLTNIDELANDLYNQFDKSMDAREYIIEKYINTKEALMNISKNENAIFHSQFQKNSRSKKEKPHTEIICERLNFLCY